MTSDDSQSTTASSGPLKQERTSPWFSVPEPVRRVFDKFPLRTYPTNDLPRRSPRRRETATLYIFTSPKSARRGAPSFNPACLKWQVRQGFFFCEPAGCTDPSSGLSQVQRSRLSNGSLKQPCFSYRCLTLHPTCSFPERYTDNPSAVQQDLEVDHFSWRQARRGGKCALRAI